jgi:hypothetical protein
MPNGIEWCKKCCISLAKISGDTARCATHSTFYLELHDFLLIDLLNMKPLCISHNKHSLFARRWRPLTHRESHNNSLFSWCWMKLW